MLPYQRDEKKLKELLEKLFEDDGESALEDVKVMRRRTLRPETSSSCCHYNYADYGG